MEAPGDSPATPDAPIIFRSKKKRPTLRSRREELETDATPTQAPSSEGAGDEGNEDEGEEDVSVAEVLRQRRRQARLRGVGVTYESAHPRDSVEDEGGEGALVPGRDAMSPEAVGGISGRFAPQTGLVGELVNKHMMEYVESKLASRHAPPTTTQSLPPPPTDAPPGATEAQKPTIQGKLMEVDLGEEARSRNVALTEKARRRLQGDAEEGESSAEGERRGKKGGGRNSGRNRRGSDDVKRDLLVEQFLHENRPDLNIPIEEAPPPATPPSDTPADDRIAEEFKREFLDAVASRRQKRRAAKPAARPGDKRAEGDVLKGPKLGGSRNVRSTVRDILLQQEKDREKARGGAGRR